MRVIDRKFLPTRVVGIMPHLVAYLSLEKFGAAGWVYGVAFSILGLLTISTIILFFKEEIANPWDIKP